MNVYAYGCGFVLVLVSDWKKYTQSKADEKWVAAIDYGSKVMHIRTLVEQIQQFRNTYRFLQCIKRPTDRPTNESMKQEVREKVANISLTCRNVSIRIVIYTDLYTFTSNNSYTVWVCCRSSFGINFIQNKSNLCLSAFHVECAGIHLYRVHGTPNRMLETSRTG